MTTTKRGITSLTAAAIVLAGCAPAQNAGTATIRGAAASAASKAFMMIGVLTLYDAPTVASGCLGADGYLDIRPGTSVTVKDADGTIIALGSLGSTYSSGDRCFYPFTVKDVPGQSDFYSVEVANRGESHYNGREARSTICITMGS